MTTKYFTTIPAYPKDRPITLVRLKNYDFQKVDPAKMPDEMNCPYCGAEYGVLQNGAWACGWIDCETWYQPMPEKPKKPEVKYEPELIHCEQPEELKKAMSIFSQDPVGFILFTGLAGRGKTYLARAIINDSVNLHKKTGHFINVSELYREWIKAKKEMMDEDLILRYSECKVLALDDIGKRAPTDAFFDFLYMIINIRLNSKLGTIFTTNCTAAEISEKFGNELVSRIYSGKVYVFNEKTDEIYQKDRRTMHHQSRNASKTHSLAPS